MAKIVNDVSTGTPSKKNEEYYLYFEAQAGPYSYQVFYYEEYSTKSGCGTQCVQIASAETFTLDTSVTISNGVVQATIKQNELISSIQD